MTTLRPAPDRNAGRVDRPKAELNPQRAGASGDRFGSNAREVFGTAKNIDDVWRNRQLV